MTTQPEALRLADELEAPTIQAGAFRHDVAAELRRQHEEITQLRHGAGVANRCIADIAAQRDALLEALKTVEWHGQGSCWVVDADKIAAAIAKAEENT